MNLKWRGKMTLAYNFFINAAFGTNFNVIMKSQYNYVKSNDVNFTTGHVTSKSKGHVSTARAHENSIYIWLLISCDTGIYAVIPIILFS